MNLTRGSFCILLSLLALRGVAPAQTQSKASQAYRKVLFLGNSITLHGPKADIDWLGNWGMAASAEEKDYVHLFAKAVADKWGKAPEVLVKNIAEFERGHAAYDPAAKLQEAIDFQADLIVLAIGENVPALKSAEDHDRFRDNVAKLLRTLKAERKPTVLVRSCFWTNEAKDNALRQASSEVGATYVDISKVSKQESHFARSERPFKHEGVANHPGDKGMQAIAAALAKALPE